MAKRSRSGKWPADEAVWDRVTVEYYDLMSPEMERFPEMLAKVSEGAQVPLVFVGDDLLSSGGKVSVPAIAKHLSSLLPG